MGDVWTRDDHVNKAAYDRGRFDGLFEGLAEGRKTGFWAGWITGFFGCMGGCPVLLLALYWTGHLH